jgi:hypothetical protein
MGPRDVFWNPATDRIHRARIYGGAPVVQFDNDPMIQIHEPEDLGSPDGVQIPFVPWGVRLAVHASGKRAAVLPGAVSHQAIFIDDAGVVKVFPRSGGGGWQHIRPTSSGFEVVLQRPHGNDLPTATFYVFDPYAVPGMIVDVTKPHRTFEGRVDSMGIADWVADDQLRMVHEVPNPVINGVQFYKVREDKGFRVGQVDAGELGNIGLVSPDGAMTMCRIEYDDRGWPIGWNGYTNLLTALAVDSTGKVEVAIGRGEAPDYPEWVAFDPIPRHRLPRGEIRRLDFSPGNLVWSTDIEGGYWAYDLFVAGTPARLIFHDMRSSLEAVLERPGPVVDGKPTWVPIIHDGEPVTVLWLMKKTGAACIAYHDLNDEKGAPFIDELKRWREQGYAFYIGQQVYPRIGRDFRALDPLDNAFCLDKSLEVNTVEFDVFLVRAVWRGNYVPPGWPRENQWLAYDPGTLARTALYIAQARQHGRVRGMIAFGGGRNDTDQWSIDQFELEAKAAPAGHPDPLARTSIVVAPPPPHYPRPGDPLPPELMTLADEIIAIAEGTKAKIRRQDG